jgi:hypothetical protein
MTKKKGIVSGLQRYICRNCGHSFRNSRRPSRLLACIWNAYVWRRSTVKELADQYGRSIDWIRKQLRDYKLPSPDITPCEMVAVIDCVFFGRTSGYLVVRDPNSKRNIYWSQIRHETIAEYQRARDAIEAQGFVVRGVVLDGKPGVRTVFSDLPVQMCHFHQKAIITKHLTRRPKLEAGKQLREIVSMLCVSTEQSFVKAIEQWHLQWADFLKERTVNQVTGRWCYTHKRLRSAYNSIKRNLPYLFAYKRHPKLHIPNTTNSLDGYFAHLKGLLQVHRGLKPELKHKIIVDVLQNRPQKN